MANTTVFQIISVWLRLILFTWKEMKMQLFCAVCFKHWIHSWIYPRFHHYSFTSLSVLACIIVSLNSELYLRHRCSISPSLPLYISISLSSSPSLFYISIIGLYIHLHVYQRDANVYFLYLPLLSYSLPHSLSLCHSASLSLTEEYQSKKDWL